MAIGMSPLGQFMFLLSVIALIRRRKNAQATTLDEERKFRKKFSPKKFLELLTHLFKKGDSNGTVRSWIGTKDVCRRIIAHHYVAVEFGRDGIRVDQKNDECA